MTGLIDRVRNERSHFTAMPPFARMLTLSYFLRSIAYPLMSIFTGAFIWQTSNDVTLLILYYMGNFAMLPVMFVINRRLLRRISLRRLYAAGTVIAGLGPLLVIFQNSPTPFAYLAYGALYGIGSGLYWANRNFLTLRHTTTLTRGYFTGLQFSLSTFTSMVVPPVAGWLIVLLPVGYQLIAVTALIFLITSALAIRGGTVEQPDISVDRTGSLSKEWQKAKLLSFAIGSVDSVIYILPTVLVLYALGNEATLGIVSGIVSFLSAVVSYAFGRKYRQSMYGWIFPAALAGFAVSGLPLFAGITVLTISWYLLVSSIADSIAWIANEPVIMDIMDAEVKRSKTTYIRLIIEREWCINAGRIAALLFLLGVSSISQNFGMAMGATACGVMALIFAGYALRKQ